MVATSTLQVPSRYPGPGYPPLGASGSAVTRLSRASVPFTSYDLYDTLHTYRISLNMPPLTSSTLRMSARARHYRWYHR